MPDVKWKHEPDDHDYPAAASYLDLLADADTVARVVAALQQAPITTQKAKDVLRACRLPLLPPDDHRVAGDLAKVHKGVALSPVLLVRGDLEHGVAAQIADGYHRVCASYHLDPDTDIPCRITGG